MQQRIYFDNAATTALDNEVLQAMMPFFTTCFGNPSSIYSYGRESRMAIENARKSVAKILHAKPSEIFFTSGGTESINTIISGAINNLNCTHIITSPIEHHATSHAIEYWQKKGVITVSYVNILPTGHVCLQHLESLLQQTNQQKTLVALMHANNEIGNITDMTKVGNLCATYNAYYFSDTVQTVGHYPLDLSQQKVHFLTGAGHKFHGPKGVGLLYINESIKIDAFVQGGGQERNMRAGTENLYGIVGFAKALELATEHYEQHSAYILSVKEYCRQQLQQNFDNIHFNGDAQNALYTVLNVAFPATEKSEMLLFNLDINNICASGGSACSSGANVGSHVINAIGVNKDKINIRFSFSKYNTFSEVDELVAILKKVL